VERALLQLVKQYVPTDAPLSPWERHCLSSAFLFERYGYFDKALEKIKDVLEPPLPLPTFPTPPQMTLRDVVARLLQSSSMPRWIGEPYKEPQAGPRTVPGDTGKRPVRRA